MGVTGASGGELNSGPELLHFELLTSVYNTATKNASEFSVSCYFANGKRWVNFPMPSSQSQLCVLGRIIGITSKTTQLAIVINDVFYLPSIVRTSIPHASPPSAAIRDAKRDLRWTGRADSGSPSKRPRRVIEESPESVSTILPSAQDEDDEGQCGETIASNPNQLLADIPASSSATDSPSQLGVGVYELRARSRKT